MKQFRMVMRDFHILCEIQKGSSFKANLEHFLESIVYILYIISKLGKSGVQRLNDVQFGAEMKKLWPFESNCAKLKRNFALTFSGAKFFSSPFSNEKIFAPTNPNEKFSQHHQPLAKFSCNLQIFVHRLN